jgi:MFS family permease
MLNQIIPVLFPQIALDFSLSLIHLGLIVTAFHISSGVPQVMVGFLQTFVKRKILMGIGLIWNSIFTILTGLSINFNQIFITRILSGLGASVQHPIGSSMIAENYKGAQRGGVMGLNIAGANVGSIIAVPLAAASLIFFGWRLTLVLFSIPGLIIGILFLLLKEKSILKINLKHGFKNSLKVLFGAYRTRAIVSLTILQSVIALRFGALAFIPTYLIYQINFDPQTSANLYSLMLIGSAIGPILWGRISDFIERKWVILMVLGTSAPIIVILTYLDSLFQIALVLFLLGLMYQSISAIVQATIADSTTSDNVDSVFGLFFTLSFTIGLIGPLIFGFLADTSGFQSSFFFVAAVTSFAIIPALALPKSR